MSHESIQAVLERTVSDDRFRARLFAEPDAVLAGFELTGDEQEALRGLCEEQGDTHDWALDRRQSKMPLWLTAGF